MNRIAAEAIIAVADGIDGYGMAEGADSLLRAASIILAQTQEDLQIYQNNLAEITDDEAKLAKEKVDKQKQLEIARKKLAEQQAKEQAEQAKEQMRTIQTQETMTLT